MPKEVFNQLSARQVTAMKEPGKFADGFGLYLYVTSGGGKSWVWRGRVHGKRRELGLGSASLVSLADARLAAIDLRRMARSGLDPKYERAKTKGPALTFQQAATRFWTEQVEPVVKSTKQAALWQSTFKIHVYPSIGDMQLRAVTQSDVLNVLLPIWTEKPETARRVRQRMANVFNWARTAGLFDGVIPTEGVQNGLPRQKTIVQHYRSISYGEIPNLMRRLEATESLAAIALRFCILTVARSSEVRFANWSEFDLINNVWFIPASRMKMGKEHRVPLSTAATNIVRYVQGLSDTLVFPGSRQDKPMSDMTLSAVLKRLKVDATVHGMRSTFRDWTEEQTDYRHEVKEAALAHQIASAVERAYRRTDLFDQRRKLM
ncbi:MAG: tyrosine-type recombinase/integrase, partial [Paracoccaceae bacterium]